MTARHARLDDDSGLPLLRLVDADPYSVAPHDEFAPEVRAVLDAVASLHSAVISWAASTTTPDHDARGRHRR